MSNTTWEHQLRIWPVPSIACWEKSKYGKKANCSTCLLLCAKDIICQRKFTVIIDVNFRRWKIKSHTKKCYKRRMQWYILVTLKKFRCFSAEVSETVLREKTPVRLNTYIRSWYQWVKGQYLTKEKDMSKPGILSPYSLFSKKVWQAIKGLDKSMNQWHLSTLLPVFGISQTWMQ